MEKVLAANYLSAMEKCLEQLGIDHFLDKMGFDQSKLQDPNAYINLDELKRVVQEAYQLSRCPHLGIMYGSAVSILNHGFVGYAAMSSPTFGSAIQTVLSYLNTRTSLVSIELQASTPSKNSYVTIKVNTVDELLILFFTEAVIAHIINMRQFLTNCREPPLKIELQYSKPDYVDKYESLFQSCLVFNAEETRFWIREEELQYPIQFADDASYQLAKKQLEEIKSQLFLKDDLVSKIKTILLNENLHQSSMETVAKQLCMTSRTLRRRLISMGVTYQELLDELREQKAKKFLLNNKLSITEISFLLGFQDTSNFSKAFKRWTGLSPTDYREQHGIH
ncbi:AraC family transcriptional regulator [Legionella waltersii]|uniref:Transcriptional regulator OruR, AraC family n=1 Tax=Legionella waltersii TaxID=66969 RepID=A0A0W1AN15_9GAMM|nr:AraC family transcriptional regulator [Legionella waltersii]KTD82616.1 transcriptional regulator OruR, AraC family [Legionella waltersii]SNV07896.1 transcriptional regulator OruR, AraC family [Legionella waltersii]